MFFATLGVIASSVERLATEIRHLQRTEVLEAEEYFSPGQKGSSAMPHKRNPVLTENLTGLARMVRSYAMPAMENVALWHERDISHSSVERMIAPDATVTLDFALARLTGVIDKLLVYPENMLKNLNKFRGLVHSQRVLLALTQAGVCREDAYRLVQRNAMKVWEEGADFLEELLADPEVTAALPEAEIREKFDLGYHTKHVDTIFRRVFGDTAYADGVGKGTPVALQTLSATDSSGGGRSCRSVNRSASKPSTCRARRLVCDRRAWQPVWCLSLLLVAGDFFKPSAAKTQAGNDPPRVIEGK